MKSIAIVAAAAAVLTSGALGFAAPSKTTHARATYAPSRTYASFKSLAYGRVPSFSALWRHTDNVALQTGATATPTATPQPTTTPTPGPTANPAYPDPVTLLNNAITVYSALKSSHFEIVIDGEQTGVEKLHIDVPGDATCKGPSMKGNASASDTLEGTSQSRKLKEKFIQVKTKTFINSTSTKKRWAQQKGTRFTVFSFPIDNPLICTTDTGGTGSGGTTDQLKDLVNLGPSTFQGTAVWHVRATDVTVDAQGQTSEQTLDFLIGQKPYLPYVFSVTVTDPQSNATLVEKQILTKFGKKVQVKAPKVGSTTP